MPGELPDYAQHIHDLNVTVASISTIPLTKLNSEDPASTVTLQASASQVGFFYLDLRNDPCGSKILADLPALYELSDLYFSQREESKMKDVRNDIEPSQDLGYKASSCDETFEVCFLQRCFQPWTLLITRARFRGTRCPRQGPRTFQRCSETKATWCIDSALLAKKPA